MAEPVEDEVAQDQDQCAHCQAPLDFFAAVNECLKCGRRFCRACKSRPDVYVPATPDVEDDEDVCARCFTQARCCAPDCAALIEMAQDIDYRHCNTCNRPFCGPCVAAGHVQLIKPGINELEYGFWWCSHCYEHWQQQAPAVLDGILDQQPPPEPIKEVEWPEDRMMDGDGACAAMAPPPPVVSIDLWYQIN